ncbi:MAG: hypothetical protein J5543_04030 [Bacteroidales bacterium]|nr:hypothetical protein [Bacteroidales bacterium]
MIRILSSTYQALKGCKNLLLLLLLTSAVTPATAQVKISIGGNVYGGGNQGEVGTEQSEYTFDKENTTDDRTSVIIRSGEIKNVFGGGRMAGVYGNSTVTIDGTTSTNRIIIGNVYGGNDIAGEVKGGAKVKTTYDASYSAKPIYIARLFGGGNGDYTYGTEPVDGVYQVKSGDDVIATSTSAFTEPDIAEVAIDLQSGAFGQVFGGGNKATVNTQTDITLNNLTDLDSFTALSDSEKIVLETYGWLDEWFTDNKPAYQFNRVFGGNNKVNMAIRPTWHLTKGTIDNLYSGGNAGGMTYPNGILLAISGDDMIINNVYGGCRMADVNPGNGNGSSLLGTEDVDANGLQEGPTVATFEASYAARVLITGGRITNVYGGNDISGKVYLGTQVEIHNSIIGDVYGGGNGSYAYTDNANLKDDSFWGDFYYNPGSLSSAAALSQHRPNVESTLIHVKGESESNPTYIGGALYCGGNSATLRKIGGELTDASANLKIGSYVVARSMFLGSNGENMITGQVHEKKNNAWTDTDILAKYKESSPDFSQMDLTTTADFEEYMRGVEVAIIPTVTFDDDYEEHSAKVGSLYFGGNIGSMSAGRSFNMGFINNLVIFEKLVGGCNNANVAQTSNNAFHMGGLTGNASDNSPKVILNIDGLKLEPKRIEYDATNHTFSYANWNTDTNGFLVDGKIYGGCYSSGFINGDVQINLRQNAISENVATAISDGTITQTLVDHREDVFNTALSIFGAGYGEESEIWGNTEINLNSNDAADVNIVKVFGGGEMGVVGKLTRDDDGVRTGAVTDSYNATVNLLAGNVGKIYGGGFEGPLTGNTTLNLIGGTAYDAIAGACNARIGGHAEAYIGDVSKTTYPTITNNVYGGNDFGGKIESSYDFSEKLTTGETPYDEDVLSASTYVEYNKGKVNYIFGGAKASYNYSIDPYLTKVGTIDQTSKLPENAPTINNAFVHFKPGQYANNAVARVYGGGQGYAGRSKDAPIFWQDQCQNQSYVLINTTDTVTFLKTLVFGSGDASGLGMDITVDAAHANSTGVTAAAVVDLISGKFDKVFGGSYQAGVTRRTIVNVPEESTISIASSLFAGAYGSKNEFPCDVFEGNVNFSSENARVHYIYGGNNDYRRTLYGKVNINSPVRYYSNEYGLTYGTVYGGGYGQNSWSQYTEVNLNDGAMVYEVYGGGYGGDVLNKASVGQMASQNSDWVFTLGNRYTADADETDVTASSSNIYDFGGLTNPIASGNQLATDYRLRHPQFDTKHNTNVHIYQGATIREYCYAGGYGQVLADNSTTATVSGSTYIDLLGGTVGKDMYAAGTTGAVEDKYKLGNNSFIASANVYVRGGTVRNVYGGGWRGSVGYSSYGNWKIENVDKVATPSAIWNDESNDIPGESNVVIGLLDANDFYAGVPAIKRSAYGGGEGGAIYGTANVYVYNGYVGYTYEDSTYEEKLDDETAHDGIGKNDLDEAGNVFGGGYVANSYVDYSNLYMYGGTVRNSLYGGGEIGPIGRGTVKGQEAGQALISKDGETHIYMYKGTVKRNVFGGGRGFDSWNSNGWMTEEEKRTIDLSSKGFIFGTTDVNIHGGEIGTAVGLADGYGNVFGGGNIGYVYSGHGTKSGKRGDGDKEGYYYDSDDNLTEDCRVNVKVYAEATAAVTINGHSYAASDFITNEDLNTLTNGSSEWSRIDQTGITIHNAIFAGGNVSVGSSSVFAFANTIYGNATASVIDCYSRDLISVGGDGVGGIYGDGNLTFVDGYRELNITNYGTDYFALPKVLNASTQAQYDALTPRQKAFYVTRYIFDGNYDGGTGDAAYLMYQKGDVVLNDVYEQFNDTQKSHWTASMSVINEGRYINTVQRCDFCGIRGSRLVLRGAMDRAQDKNEADYTNYTINRVGELSLNQNNQNGATHGCYFGIYNVVKLLGGVTSDVKFKSVRTTDTDKPDDAADGSTTYFDWKKARITAPNRNNGTSPNKITLASGVFLEIVKSVDENGDKTYGPITGVVQLDLLNVATGEGGGYVYAENIHGEAQYDPDKNFASVLADANKGYVVTNKAYTYSPASSSDKMETSGNFIHPLKQIVDDCFPTANNFSPEATKSPAHYWYIRGEFFVYEQLISAYTGSAETYSSEITLPLTMSAQGNGKIRLLNVLPGLYTDPSTIGNFIYNDDPELATSDSLRISFATAEKAFGQNDPISYWDWYMASNVDKAKFLLKTYVCREEVTVNGTTYYPGQGITVDTYNSLANYVVENEDGETVSAQSFFNVTNGIGNYKTTGFLLTVDLTNPGKWNDYYTLADANEPVNHKLTTAEFNGLTDSEKANYIKSATLHCIEGGTFGQYYFEQDAVTSKGVYDMQTSDVVSGTDSIQASFKKAYVAKEDCEITIGGTTRTYLANSPISAETLSSISTEDQAHFENAYICVTTVLVSEGNYHVLNELVGETEYSGMDADIQSKFQPAYYCTSAGYWGGKHYIAGKNYQGLDYCQLHEGEREHFTFNFDALELLGNDYIPYDQTGIAGLTNAGANLNNNVIYYDYHTGTNVPENSRIYSKPAFIDYTATVPDEGYSYTGSIFVDGGTEIALTPSTQLDQDQFVKLPNDRQYYAYFGLNDDDKQSDGNYRTYIVTTTFDVGGTMYNAGKKVSESVYNDLGETLQRNLQEVIITPTQYSTTIDGKFYYCIEAYKLGDKDQYIKDYSSNPITALDGTYAIGDSVPVGTILTYNEITTNTVNYQHGLEITGDLPIEEASLYVPVTADFEDMQEDRYVTVIYEYTYSESDDAGVNYETRVEKHIINIRLKFLSGAPIIGKIREPDIVLPLETISFAEPIVEEGAFPVLTGGWQIFSTEEQAKKHRNGRDYLNKTEPMYFYQDMYWVAYYAETRLGRTFSNPVPVHVANYQRMTDVINDEHHMYINHKDLKRDPKIYISDALVENQEYNELDALHEVFALANSDYGTIDGTDNNGRTITGAYGLDFILTNDVAPTRTWTSIGDNDHCFSGEFHGNGHTLSGMQASLFGNLCGNVFNTGVMGSFTSGGIADTGDGHVENCWVWTTGTPDTEKYAVFGNPTNLNYVVNCYYQQEDDQETKFKADNTGAITPRSASDFVNGSVAYDLNSYYLEARYNLFTAEANVSNNPVINHCIFRKADGTLVIENVLDEEGHIVLDENDNVVTQPAPFSLKYTSDYAWHPSWVKPDEYRSYVERFIEDGDFRFANGLKPRTDQRYSSDFGYYIPVYPDDYIFFGQKLSYGLYEDIDHDNHPMAAVKDYAKKDGDVIDNSRHLLLTTDTETENRIYRAPAYFQNGVYGESAIFNATAAFAESYTTDGATYYPHQNMTAIDFTGSNGDTHGITTICSNTEEIQDKVAGIGNDFTDKAEGYHPLLDFERLDNIKVSGLTQNLLAYAPAPDTETNAKTNNVIIDYFDDPEYSENEDGYRTVAVQNADDVHGHAVQKISNSDYSDDNVLFTSITDHLLVDKQDFNAPMAYTFAEETKTNPGKRMWYQRVPDTYVDLSTGWEGISIPFSAELVTTQTKGELTHFYEGSTNGHEYWLRTFDGIKARNTTVQVDTAQFVYLGEGPYTKEYTNTFLWDYYYSKDPEAANMAGQDANTDEYQKEDDARTYYSEEREYSNYPYSAAGTPYIIGFPGVTYYEFDLSGTFVPANTYNEIARLDKQTITFASMTGATIEVSDDELASGKASEDQYGYTFTPNYLSKDIDAGAYILKSDGSAYKKTANATAGIPFRPFFTASSSGGAPKRGLPEEIVFSNTTGIGEITPSSGDLSDGLYIYAKQGKIIVESHRKTIATVRILTPMGINVASFTIEPGQTVSTPINTAGVYTVNRNKIFVK